MDKKKFMTIVSVLTLSAIISTLYLIISYIKMFHFSIKSVFIAREDDPLGLEEELKVPKGYAVHTSECKIQEFNLMDDKIKEYFEDEISVECSSYPSLVTVINGPFLKVNLDALKDFGGHLDYCLYIPIYRNGDGFSDDKYSFGEKERFFNLIKVKDEFIKIECYSFYNLIYEDFYPFIFRKDYVDRRCKRIQSQYTKQDISERVSIMILGTDSVSRLNFKRFCPKIHNILMKQLKAIEFKGYNKVGDNTFHNLIPMFIGSFVSELDWKVSKPFDKFEFIWKEYSRKGYITVFAEDDPDVALFNYEKLGFFYTPSDYYLRPFYVAFNQSKLFAKSEYECMGNRFHSEVVLNYAYDFLKAFNQESFFSFFFMCSLTHPSIIQLQLAENLYEKFFYKVISENLLNNTILFFLSDHGIRFGRFRRLYQGRLEERLPMFYVVFPPWFKKKYPKIIKTVITNSLRLTTPFDVYATFKDLLNFSGTPNPPFSQKQKGISLFNEIPENRTCHNASILPHWCTCQEMKSINKTELIVHHAALFIVKAINQMTKKFRNVCEELALNSIMTSYISSANENLLKYKWLAGTGDKEDVVYNKRKLINIKDLTITIKTYPSQALFEATVRVDETRKSMNLAGDISRVNKYGNQSHCMHNYNLKKYCYCKDIVR